MNHPKIVRRWISAPELQQSYLTLLVPGGAAAELVTESPAGMSHLIEHLLYRQNDREGHPFDHLGGKFGLLTEREVMFALLIFAPQDMPGAARQIERWWVDLQIEETMLAEEAGVVTQELQDIGGGTQRILRSHLMSCLLPGTHLERDFAGEPQDLHQISKTDLSAIHRRMVDLGYVLVSIGPLNPWPDQEPNSFEGPCWRPPAIHLPQEASHKILQASGLSRATIQMGRVVAGLLSPDAAGSYAVFGSLEFGRVHEEQQRFHVEMQLRHLSFDLRMYAEVGILTATAICPFDQVEEVSALIESLLERAANKSSPHRLRGCALHSLRVLRDNPSERARLDAERLFLGAPSLDEILHQIEKTTDEEILDLARRSQLSSPVRILLTAPD